MADENGPKRSKDGRFYWDGERWQPMPKDDRRMPGQVLPTPVLVALVIVATVFVFLFLAFTLA